MNAPSAQHAIARFARFAVSSQAGDDHAATLQLTDAFIALLAGADCNDGRRVAGFFGEFGSGTLSLAATLAATIRLTELDDIHRATAVTPSAIVVPAVLAICAMSGVTVGSRNVLDAMHVGEEIAVSLALSLGGANLLSQGCWPALTVAPFGAAAAAGRVLGLSESEMEHALALALAQTPPPIGRTPAQQPARWLLFGEAVRAGCMAALAARDGFQADKALLDENWANRIGVRDVLYRPYGAELPVGVRSAISVKPHPGAKQTMAAIYGLQAMMKGGIVAHAIEKIEVHVPHAYASMVVREPPQTGRLASFVSVSGQLALAALQPAALDDISRESVIWNAEMQRFVERVSVVPDASLDASYPAQFPARLRVTANGRTHEISVMDSLGDPSLPLDQAGLSDKAERIVGHHRDRSIVSLAGDAAVRTSSLERLCGWLKQRFDADAGHKVLA
ncbi:2-methylcitrate dehydratase PrpD [Paraburkholderia sp. GAS199]|uniref:MmgE/PrpD family protein n=1 Tax=Paraburkholderia sp. GAS199 TaxID=3035126 RepID=UPI003D22D9CD